MRRQDLPSPRTLPLFILSLLVAALAWAQPDEAARWPSFRGQRAEGVALGGGAPSRWDLARGEGLLWKTPIPGLAHSSPVIWGDRLFVTSAVRGEGDQSLRVGLYGDIKPVEGEGAHEWRVYCLDRGSGRIRWQRTAHEGVPQVQRHTKSTHANPTPATDGEHVVAFFGSEGLHVFDLEGNPKWSRDLGVLDSGFFTVPDAQWGFGSSPILHDGKVVVQVDVQGDDYLAAFDVRDGSELWRTPRREVPTWSTPTVYESAGRSRLAVNGFQHIGGYDLDSGEEVWRMTGGGDIPVPTPIVAHGLIFFTNSHGRSNPIFAVRTTASGDISLDRDTTSNEHVAWGKWRDGAYMPTPIVYGEHLYVLRDNGALFCYEARTGKENYRARLGKGSTGFSASPVAADGKLYFTSEMGDVFVVAAGPVFELVARNSMEEVTMATPAIVEGTLYFRTRGHVLAIGDQR